MSKPGADGTTPPRQNNSGLLLGVLWLHVPFFAALTLLPGGMGQGRHAWGPAGAALLLAVSGALMRRVAPRAAAAPFALALLLAGANVDLALAVPAPGWMTCIDIHAIGVLALLCRTKHRRSLPAAAGVLILPRLMAAYAGWYGPGGGTTGLVASLQHAALVLVASALAISWVRQTASMEADCQAAIAAAAADASREKNRLRLLSEAASDLSAKATEDRLAQGFESELGGLVGGAADAARGVREAAVQVSRVTELAVRRTVAIAEASEQTWTSAQTVAAAVDELAASIHRASTEVREVAETSYRAMEEAGATNQTVQDLADTAGRIGNVVRTINHIARQTSMLALNATIEAARAGEAGRGFAVVANEVKQLAVRTASATSEIEREINSIQSEMATAMAAIDGMAGTVANLGGITVSVGMAMDEQGDIAKQIAANALLAAEGTQSVVTNLRALSGEIEQGERAARDGSRDAERLAEKCGEVEAAARNFVRDLLAG